jgi:DNA-binding response OmpR family regulator
VSLPRAGCVVAPAAAPAPGADALAGRHFVLVDDDAAVRRALVDRLQHWGARVTAFDSLAALHEWVHGQSGDATTQSVVDMLITDQRLPDGNGLAALALLRRRHPALPALVVTGNTSTADLALLADSGVPVLHKPFRAGALLDAINAAIDVAGADRAPGTQA